MKAAWILCACISAIYLASSISAKPDKPNPKPPVVKPIPVPSIAGESVWGTISQDGRKVTIDGDRHWYVADGRIRSDGKLIVIWILREDGKAAPGIYDVNADRSITGEWNYGSDVEVDAEGNLKGRTFRDTLRRAP